MSPEQVYGTRHGSQYVAIVEKTKFGALELRISPPRAHAPSCLYYYMPPPPPQETLTIDFGASCTEIQHQ